MSSYMASRAAVVRQKIIAYWHSRHKASRRHAHIWPRRHVNPLSHIGEAEMEIISARDASN